MNIKKLEIRDKATCIPVLAISTMPEDDAEHKFWRRQGFGEFDVVLLRADDSLATYDPFKWYNFTGGTRTMTEAHIYIRDHWDEIKDCDVIDVEVIVCERKTKKTSEMWGNNGN